MLRGGYTVNVREVVDGILAWSLLIFCVLAPVVGLYWLTRTQTGVVITIIGVAVVIVAWLYWLTNRRQRDRDEVDAHGRRLEEIGEWQRIVAGHLGIDVHPTDVDPSWAEDDTAEQPAVQPDTEPMALTDAGVTPAVEAERSTRWDAAAKEEADQARRAKEAARVDEVLKRFDFSGRKR